MARLAPAFRLKAARPVDLFPQTPHVERWPCWNARDFRLRGER
ncbi:MAG: hypothetical protein ACLU4B_01195 [Bilophila wadsworthia]